MTSWWARWRLKSPASRLLTQPFIQAQIKENIKAPRHWLLCGEFTGDRWIPPHKRPVTRKMFPSDDVIMHDINVVRPVSHTWGHCRVFSRRSAILKEMQSAILYTYLFSVVDKRKRYGEGMCCFHNRIQSGYRSSFPCRNWSNVPDWVTLQWRHNGCDSISNYQPHDCLFNRLFRRRSKKTSKLRVTSLCAGNSPGTREFPAQMASNAVNVSIWWRHHEVQSARSYCFLINRQIERIAR